MMKNRWVDRKSIRAMAESVAMTCSAQEGSRDSRASSSEHSLSWDGSGREVAGLSFVLPSRCDNSFFPQPGSGLQFGCETDHSSSLCSSTIF